MAVLEKIRKRSVLLFIIIIGALLAFILGDFLNSGRSLFGPGDTIAAVGNAKVKQMDLSKQSEQVENYLKQSRANGQNIQAEMADPDYRYQQALENALYQKLIDEECDRLDLEVTDDFISNFVSNPSSSMFVWQTLLGQLGGSPQETMGVLQQYGIIDPTTYLDAINNPARYRIEGQMAQALTGAWQAMEDILAQQVQYTLYNNVINSMLQVNKADAKAYFDNQNTMANVQVASVPMATVNDNDITVEESDYQAVYDSMKDSYRILEENREIAYIVVPIQASEADYAKADEATRNLIADLQTTEGLQALANHKGFMHKNVKITQDEMGRNMQYAALAKDSAGIQKGMVKELFAPRGTKTIAKVLETGKGIDNIVYAFYPVDNEKQADSLFTDKSLAAVDSVINSLTNGQLNNLKTSLINPAQDSYAGMFAGVESVAKALETAPVNQYYFVNDTTSEKPVNGVLVVKERSESVPMYELAVMTYDVYPSEATRQELTQNLHNFIANHPTAEQFVNDTTNLYNIRYTMVNPSKYTLANSQTTPNSRALVKWALDAKKGAVSPVFSRQKMIFGRGDQPDETQDYLVALAVVDVFDDYLPLDSYIVKDELKGRATNNKKAKVLIDKYAGKGKTIGEYANAMGVTPQNMNVAFGAGTIGGNAQGALAAAKKGDLVGPVQGNYAVYVFQVDDVTTPDFAAADLTTRLGEASRAFRMPQLSPIMLIGNRKVNNNLIKYFTPSPTEE